ADPVGRGFDRVLRQVLERIVPHPRRFTLIRNRIALIALTILLALGGSMAALAQNRPGYTEIPSDDAEMAEAQNRARSPPSEFWSKLASPDTREDGFALKVGLPIDDKGSEHIWVSAIERRDGKIFGRISNRPVNLKSVRQGQRIEVAESQ